MRLLTDTLIDRYKKLDAHDREILRGFARVFPGASIEWISTEEQQSREEKTVPATTIESLKIQNSKFQTKAVAASESQPRLFYKMETNECQRKFHGLMKRIFTD